MSVATARKLEAGAARGLLRRVPEAVSIRLASLVVLAVAWQAASILFTERFVPGPASTFAALWDLARGGELIKHFGVTMARMLASFAAAMLVGMVIGTAMGLYRRAEQSLDMWVMVGLTIPGLCYIIVSFMWLGLNDRAAVLAITWATFPAIAINVWQGVKAIDPRLIDMARVFGASAWRRTTRVVVPQVLPYLMAAARFGLGIIWKVTVLVELLGRSDGIGYMLNYSFQMFDMADVFAWTIFFTLVMLAIELAILKPIERRLFMWRPEIRA
ncbi:MAG: ABC transporter permease [Burkholderiales bacterium]|nr:ABC transporter permease [Burkholderiales bacterium]